MKEKKKAFGLLWLNMGSLTFKGIPNVCIVSAEKTPGDFIGPGNNGQCPAADLRLAGLKHTARVECSEADGTPAIDELIKLKQQQGLYREISGNIVCTPGADGKKCFRAEIPIPSKLSPGKYSVQVFAVKGGNIIAKSELPITANLVGTPAFLATLAFHNGALYGILATLIAALSGLAIGLVFRTRGAH
jgi:hypothetical protein